MYIEKAIQLIEVNIDTSDFCGPIMPDKVAYAETILGIVFPKSYSIFLHRYGAGDIAGIEIFGIIKDPKNDSEMIPNAIWLTQDLRKRYSLPQGFIVVSETGYGPYYVIDTLTVDENLESPVYIWDAGNKKEKVFNSFGEFLYILLSNSI